MSIHEYAVLGGKYIESVLLLSIINWLLLDKLVTFLSLCISIGVCAFKMSLN